MKKLALLAVAAFAMSIGAASADPVETPIGSATVAEDGAVIYLDGDAGNPDPLDGWARIGEDGSACAEDEGSYGDEGSSPTCAN